jgi:hypothetical protein
MYSVSDLKGMLFIDIETASNYRDLEELKSEGPDGLYDLWLKKCKTIREYSSGKVDLTEEELYMSDASIYPEFGRIITISIGQIKFDEVGIAIDGNVRSFYGNDEAELLQEFCGIMSAVFSKKPNIKLVGHNIKKFDMPWIVKKCLINGIIPPSQFHFQKLTPWENCLLDTYDVWKFGGISSASLDAICNAFGIPSPKGSSVAGPEVSGQYWEGNLEDIKDYCELDVKATMNVILKMSNMEII